MTRTRQKLKPDWRRFFTIMAAFYFFLLGCSFFAFSIVATIFYLFEGGAWRWEAMLKLSFIFSSVSWLCGIIMGVVLGEIDVMRGLRQESDYHSDLLEEFG